MVRVFGSQIKADTTDTVVANEPIFQNFKRPFTAVADESGKAKLSVTNTASMVIGDLIWFQDDPINNYPGENGTVTDIDPDTSITTDVNFNGAGSGDWVKPAPITFDDFTPGNFLRTINISIQYHDNVERQLLASLEADQSGHEYFPIDAAKSSKGFFDFQFSVQKDDALNLSVESVPSGGLDILAVVTTL
jgi:hypothetical protein